MKPSPHLSGLVRFLKWIKLSSKETNVKEV